MIILLGLAGSGKTTQGKLLAKNLNCAWLSLGELLRNSVSAEHQKSLNAGHLLSDDIVLGVLEKALENAHPEQVEIVLDGCPRTLRQAEWLLSRPYKITAVIHLTADEAILKERLRLRARADDHEKAINERFSEYKKVILPIISLMKDSGVPVYEIYAEGGSEVVANRIKQVMQD